MNPCIVSFASMGRENYNEAMLGLIRSINKCGFPLDTMMYQFDGYIDEYQGIKIELGKSLNYPQPKNWFCYNNKEVPYQFKLAMIERARDAGYKQVIWCDSTMRVIKDFTPLLEKAKEQGVVVFDNLGHPLYKWISDLACERLGIEKEELKTVPQIMACCIIFDFDSPQGNEIFEEWLIHAQDGVSFANYTSTREGFMAHRHDQAVLSYLVHKRGIKFEPYGSMVYNIHADDKSWGNDYYFVNRGVKDGANE